MVDKSYKTFELDMDINKNDLIIWPKMSDLCEIT